MYNLKISIVKLFYFIFFPSETKARTSLEMNGNGVTTSVTMQPLCLSGDMSGFQLVNDVEHNPSSTVEELREQIKQLMAENKGLQGWFLIHY